MESPVAQWLEHPTRSRRVVGSNPIWNSDFFPSFHLMLKKPYHVVISKTRLDTSLHRTNNDYTIDKVFIVRLKKIVTSLLVN